MADGKIDMRHSKVVEKKNGWRQMADGIIDMPPLNNK